VAASSLGSSGTAPSATYYSPSTSSIAPSDTLDAAYTSSSTITSSAASADAAYATLVAASSLGSLGTAPSATYNWPSNVTSSTAPSDAAYNSPSTIISNGGESPVRVTSTGITDASSNAGIPASAPAATLPASACSRPSDIYTPPLTVSTSAIRHPRYSAPLVRVPSTTNEDIDGGVSRYTTLNDCTITITTSGDIHAIEIALSSPSPASTLATSACNTVVSPRLRLGCRPSTGCWAPAIGRSSVIQQSDLCRCSHTGDK